MKYYSYNEYSDDDDPGGSGYVVTKSEDEIIEEYYPYWRGRMIAKLGEEIFNKYWSKQDCIDDWIVINWAWEVK